MKSREALGRQGVRRKKCRKGVSRESQVVKE